MSIIAIISDIHGNLVALDEVLKDLAYNEISKVVLLGDLIDYGMQSNEVIQRVTQMEQIFLAKIWGNHEASIINEDYSRFSSERGVRSAKYTKSVLDAFNEKDLLTFEKKGFMEFSEDGLSFLAVHGSLEDPFWGTINPEKQGKEYMKYDVVLSGHSHYSHCFTQFYSVNRPERRNKRPVLFINPGSIGQPRNHNPNAQYALFNTSTKEVVLRCIPYDVEAAMSLYDGQIDSFYRERLKLGV